VLERDHARQVRAAHASTLLTCNRDATEWLTMFADMLLAQSAVDRVANSAYYLVMKASRIVRA